MRLPAAAYSATDRRHGHTIAKGAESTPSTLSVPADREGHYVLLLRGHLGRCAPPMHDDVLNERRRIPPIRPHTEAPLTPARLGRELRPRQREKRLAVRVMVVVRTPRG